MRKKILLIIAFLMTTACASTAMKGYVGKSISEAYMTQGKPENIFDLPDGRRAFQFRWGGGSGVVPGYASSTVTPMGYGYQVTTTGVPATYVESAGCLVTLIARPRGNDFIVEEYRIPKQLVC